MAKFSDLAVSAMNAYESVAQAEYELERARDQAVESAKSVVSALRSTLFGKVALVTGDGDVWVYSLEADGEDYKVETIAGDFEVPDRDGDEPTAPVEPDEPDGPEAPEAVEEPGPEPEPLPAPAWLVDPLYSPIDEFAVS